MCFSATASFTAAASLSLIGIANLWKVKDSRWYPFAAIPLLFGLQQFFEGLVWITLNQGDHVNKLHSVSVYVYIIFASMVWPIWIPNSFYILEKHKRRKKILNLVRFIGYGCGIFSLFFLTQNVITVEALHHHLYYPFFNHALDFIVPITYLPIVVGICYIFYLSATLMPLFISSVPLTWLAAIFGGVFYAVAQSHFYLYFSSVWCFFAALISALSYVIIIRTRA